MKIIFFANGISYPSYTIPISKYNSIDLKHKLKLWWGPLRALDLNTSEYNKWIKCHPHIKVVMLLDRSIVANMLDFAISFFVSNKKWCVGVQLYIFKYLILIRTLYDIVYRAVEAHIRELKPTARTNKEKLNTEELVFLMPSLKRLVNAIAVTYQNSSSAVHFLLCKKLNIIFLKKEVILID